MLNKLLKDALKEPGFLTLDLNGPGIEVKPGRRSPIYVNMKATWKNPYLLFNLSHELQKLCLDCDSVIGIETGGSPYAVSIAQNFGISLVLARKKPKKELGILAGSIDGKVRKFAIVDDVLATGKSMEPAFKAIKQMGKQVVYVAVLSYGMDELIAKKYDIEVRSLFNIKDLINCLEKNKRKKVEKYIFLYQKKLKSLIL